MANKKIKVTIITYASDVINTRHGRISKNTGLEILIGDLFNLAFDTFQEGQHAARSSYKMIGRMLPPLISIEPITVLRGR